MIKIVRPIKTIIKKETEKNKSMQTEQKGKKR